MIFRKYTDFITGKESLKINEDIQASKNYLKNMYLQSKKERSKSKEGDEVKLSPEEVQQAERNPDFLKIKELLSKNPGWVFTFVKFFFEDKVPYNELVTLYNRIKSLQDLVERLPMPIIQYANTKPTPEDKRTGFERLGDDLEQLHRYRLTKKFVDQLPGELRREYTATTAPIKKKIEDIANAFDEFGKNPDGTKDEKKNKELQNLFFSKISRYRTKGGDKEATSKSLRDIIISSEAFIKTSSNDSITKFMVNVEKCNEKLGENYGVEPVYEQNDIIILEIKSFVACKELCSNTSWCIASQKYNWDSYVGGDAVFTKQYAIFNFNLPPSDTKSIIGITIQRGGNGIRACHIKNDQNFVSEIKEYCKKWKIPFEVLAPMSAAEEDAKKRRVKANKEIIKPKLSVKELEKCIVDGADPNAEDGKPLKNAVSENNLETAKFLLGKGASANIGEPIRQATGLEMIKLLIENGAQMVNQVFVKICNNYDALKYCLDAGADPNFEFGMPLRLAVESGNMEIIKLLVQYGADPTLRRCMPFKWAANTHNFEMIEYLCKLIKDKIPAKEKDLLLTDLSHWIKTASAGKDKKEKEDIEKKLANIKALMLS